MRVINALPQLHHASVAPLLVSMLAWEKVASPCDRVSLLVKGPIAAGIADVVRGEAQGVPSISGIIYGLDPERAEIIAEGERADLEALENGIASYVGAANLRTAWQQAAISKKSSYSDAFPLVTLSKRMRAAVTLRSDTNTLDYFARHVQIEAVFNRGLKLERSRPDDEEIVFTVTGDPKRVRGFLKWCYRGPPLARETEVSVQWSG